MKEVNEQKTGSDQRFDFEGIIGRSKEMQKVVNLVKVIAVSPATVLIGGETGTGKELVARAIHASSPRKFRSFIKVDCTALPETLLESELFGYIKGAFTDARYNKPGKFEIADGGTIFLDEIGEIPLGVQAKLLRVLEDHSFEPLGCVKTVHVDIRIIAATNRNLSRAADEGLFRKDLYYRLNIFPILIPPLRERPDDIPVLIDYFMGKLTAIYDKKIRGMDRSAREFLNGYSWPGNVRQLMHAIEYAIISTDDGFIRSDHFPRDIAFPGDDETAPVTHQKFSIPDAEKGLIVQALKKNRFNRMKTAHELGMSRITLWRKMKRYCIV